MRDGAGGGPGHTHSYVERVTRNIVEDGNGRVQACREERLIDLEIRVGSRAEGCQQLNACTVVKLVDKDVGPATCLFIDGVLKAVDKHKGVDTAIRTQVVEVGLGGQAMEPEHGGSSRCCMGPRGAGCESECYEG